MDKWRKKNWILFLFGIGWLTNNVNGQCTEETRPYIVNVSHLPQYVTSSNYPGVYPNNEDCAWLIVAPTQYDKIIINIEDVDAEGITTPCQYDYLTIFDGGDNTANEVAKLCNANNDDVNALVSTTDLLYVTFVSDYAYNYNGFKILVFANNTGTVHGYFANQPTCGLDTTLTATSIPQVLMSPNLPDPYDSNLLCVTKIYPETLYFAINIELYFLDLYNDTGCENGSLAISSVSDSVADELLTECRSAVTYTPTVFPLEVTGSYALLNFSTGHVGDSYYGYMLKYYEIFKGINMTSPVNGSTIKLTFPEDEPTGHLNESVAVVSLTHTGSLNLQILPTYEATTDEPIDIFTDLQIFSLTDEPPYVYLNLISNFDYETINKFSLLVKIIDTDVPLATYMVTFNITITDVNDFSPEFDNLPNNMTLKRGLQKDLLLYTVNATDADGTVPHQQIEFEIFSGNDDGVFAIDANSGELTLMIDAKFIPLQVTQYVLLIGAYSGDDENTLAQFSTYTVYIDPDSPPSCSHTEVWTETIDSNLATSSDVIQFLDSWSCSDDRVNVTYELGLVVANLTSDLFDVDVYTGDISLVRPFAITEVLDRQFQVEIIVKDSMDQTESFMVLMNVTALTCLPNPRRLYVRMDQELDGVIMSDFNCTKNSGMMYRLEQYPEGTFDVIITNDDRGNLVLKKPVVKFVFYSLSITITDHLDIATVHFRVIVQTERCFTTCGAVSMMPPSWYRLTSMTLIFLALLVVY
ncbi:plasma membrane adhesion molecule [Mactra antiquata]